MDEVPADTISRCARGDVAALGEIYALLGGRIWRLCRNLLGNDVDAEDAVQEIFLRVLGRADQFEGRSRFSTWLYRLAVHHCLNVRKARQRRERRLPEQATLCHRERSDDPLAQTMAQEQREQLGEWLARLDDRSRALLLLREVEGLEYREIAAVLDLPLGTVMSGLSRARERLRIKAHTRPGTRGVSP